MLTSFLENIRLLSNSGLLVLLIAIVLISMSIGAVIGKISNR